MLNRQRRMNRTDTVGAMQLRLSRQIAAYRDFLDRRGDFGAEAENGICELIRRSVGTRRTHLDGIGLFFVGSMLGNIESTIYHTMKIGKRVQILV